MQVHSRNDNATNLLAEYDRLTADISALDRMLAGLRNQRAIIELSLDRLTQPPPPVCVQPKAGNQDHPKNHGTYGYRYKQTHVTTPDKISAYLGILKKIMDDYPQLHAQIADRVNAKTRRRQYLCRDRFGLHPGKDCGWTIEHSVDLGNGWYADKNLSGERMKTILERAAHAVDLEPGTDAALLW